MDGPLFILATETKRKTQKYTTFSLLWGVKLKSKKKKWMDESPTVKEEKRDGRG